MKGNTALVVAVFGLPGSGKSFFAVRFSNLIQAVYVSSDQLRKKMFENRTYKEEEKLLVYRKILLLVHHLLSQDKNVVLDATFYKSEIRTYFQKEITGKAKLLFIEVRADEELIRERLKRKRQESEADYKVYQKIKKAWEPMEEDHLVLQSGKGNLSDMLQLAMTYVQQND